MFEVHTFDPKTVSWWFDQLENIDLDPPYQRRGHLWSERDRAFLIDSILNGYDVPKVYMADFSFGRTSLNTSGKQYAVIDGKQRLGAIFDFLGNKLRLSPDFEWSINPELRLGGLSYNDLLQNHPKVASRFANFNLSVMRVITDDDAKINELFVRLNRSKPLTGAEVRNAMGGIVPKLIRDLCAHEFFQTRIRFSTNRRQDQNAAAKLLLIEFRGNPVGTQKPNIDRFVQEGIKAQAGVDEFVRAASRCADVLSRMTGIFSLADPLLSSAGPLPVLYWFTRDTRSSNDPLIRPFLVYFSDLRKRNQKLAKVEDGAVDPELVLYDRLDRSTDNQGSIEGRVDILRRRFTSFQNAIQRP